ncbi:hypothetical protein RHSIM_Rhsim10G0060900 [Rhododendron simsii]|uniref:Protein FAR1-RELATED SEQUENCE n=1 Tax=Rhododendron simsii TaxID=118357 RepID=A0A834LCG4_RHOSS|nr:hypothetical protein RHSIM_Rhsim10G0060900 [Rhododendron simsii]
MDQFSSRTSKDVNVKNDINKFPEEEDDLGDLIEDGVNGKQGLDSQIGLEGLNMLTARDVFKMKLDSEENAHAFYNAYAKIMGFSIRKDRKKVRRENVVVSRKCVCSRQGVRAKKYLERVDRLRAPRAETRVGCKAIFRVRYGVKMREYIVTHFVSGHNHPLVAPHCVPFLWSHRSVTNADKAQTKAMRNVGISTGQIMDLMTIQSGGFDKVGFVRKDLHNSVQADRKVELKDGDVEGILGYLSAKALDYPLFFYKYDVDHENCLDKLFWADSRSRLDYAAFGDVLVFDTTYRTNAYKKPFVMLCDVNGDKAMRQAIITVIPSAKHRLCTWHLQRNAVSNVHKPKFHEDFKRLKSLECDRDEFDKAWAGLVKQYNIESNSWVVEAYRNRHNETVKFGHVTFFWNGNRSGYFNREMEEYVEIPSDSGITFNVQPKMKALEIAEKARDAILGRKFHQVPVAIGGPGLLPGVRFCKDVPDGGLANVAATVMNLHGFEAPSDYEPTLIEIIATPDIPNVAKSQQEQHTPLGFCVKIRKHPQHCLQVSVHNFAFQLVNAHVRAPNCYRPCSAEPLIDKWPAFKHPLYKRPSGITFDILK